MASIEDTDSGLLGVGFEPKNTFVTNKTTEAFRDNVMEEREFFLNNLRRELKPEGASADFGADIIGSGIDIGGEEGTPLADLEVTPLHTESHTEIVHDRNDVTRITIRDSATTTSVVIFMLRRSVMVSVNDTVMPWSDLLAASYIHVGEFGHVIAESEKRAYVFKNTTVAHMIDALMAIDNETHLTHA